MTTMQSAQPAGRGRTFSDARRNAGWIALTALAPAVWGTTYIVTTHGLPAGHPVFAALTRTLPAGGFALLAARQLPRGTWWWKSLILGALNMACFFPLLFVAAQRLPGGVAATLGAAQPIIVAGLAVVVLSEHPSDGVGSVSSVSHSSSWGRRRDSTPSGWLPDWAEPSRWGWESCSPRGGADPTASPL